MKKKLLTLFLFLFFSVVYGQNSRLYDFVRKSGFKTIATCAHPSNTTNYNLSSISEDDNNIYISVVYNETFFGKNEQTNVILKKSWGRLGINNIVITKDYSPVDAFYFTKLIKNAALSLYEVSSSKNDEVKNILESKFYKSFNQFNGIELALFILNINYLSGSW